MAWPRVLPSVAPAPTLVLPPVGLALSSAAGVLSSACAAFEAVAPEMAAQLARVLGAAGPGGLSGVGSEAALAVVEAVEAVKAWADALSVGATAAMVAQFETDFAGPESESPSAWERRRFRRHCRSAAAREIQVATGLPITQCQRRVWFACCEPERVGPVRELMRAGRVTLARAMTLTEATEKLDGFTAAAIATRVLRPISGPDGVPLPGMAPLSEATFRARLHRQLVLHHGLVGQAQRTYEEALKRRRLTGEPHRDGTGALVITGDGARIAAAQGRVDRIARRLRNGGDPRTLDQLRADVATDLLLRGWIPGDPTFTALGQPPAAVVQLTVSLSTILGLDDGVGQITGWGAVSAQQARELALRLGSIWKRVVTDPVTGRAVEASAGTYTVPAAMAEQVKVRDGTCRAPGCEIPADNADLDHSEEWKPGGAGGPTAETNLAAVHRGHHNLKTSGFWDSDQKPDGTLHWTTATGRSVITYPYIYDHPDNLPVKTSTLEARLGRRLAPAINPDIPLPGRFNIFDEFDWTHALAPAIPPPARYTYAGTHHETREPDWKAHLTGDPPF